MTGWLWLPDAWYCYTLSLLTSPYFLRHTPHCHDALPPGAYAVTNVWAWSHTQFVNYSSASPWQINKMPNMWKAENVMLVLVTQEQLCLFQLFLREAQCCPILFSLHLWHGISASRGRRKWKHLRDVRHRQGIFALKSTGISHNDLLVFKMKFWDSTGLR